MGDKNPNKQKKKKKEKPIEIIGAQQERETEKKIIKKQMK